MFVILSVMFHNFTTFMETANGKYVLSPEEWMNLRELVTSGMVVTFVDIFKYTKSSLFANSIGMHFNTLKKRRKQPRTFTYGETGLIAGKMEVSHDLISKLIINQINGVSKNSIDKSPI